LLKVWEAARATCAAPSYFKPYRRALFEKEYYDGGLYNNNPARIALCEAKRPWGKGTTNHPNILLSVGSGYGVKPPDTAGTGLWGMFMSLVKCMPMYRTIQVLAGRLNQNLNSEATWLDNYGTLENHKPSDYCRLNPIFSCVPPNLDDITALEDGTLGKEANQFLASPSIQAKIENVVLRLVATSFYFYPLQQAILDDGEGTFFAGLYTPQVLH
jgi:hypothetical protein